MSQESKKEYFRILHKATRKPIFNGMAKDNHDVIHQMSEAGTLDDADFSYMDLRNTNFKNKKIVGAKFTGSDLTGSVFNHSRFIDCDFTNCRMVFTEIKWAKLEGCCLWGANLKSANIKQTDLCGSKVNPIDFRVAGLLEGVPVINNIHQRVYQAAKQPEALDMGVWHSHGFCGSTHCRAGWVTHLAFQAGRDLENQIGTSTAAALIYIASDRALTEIPDWYPEGYDADEISLKDMEAKAKAESKRTSELAQAWTW